MRWKIVLVLYIIFSILDGLLTIYGIKTGLVYEANPLVAAVMDWVGLFWAFILLKGFSCAGGIFIFFTIKMVPTARWGLLFCMITMLFVVGYNIFLLVHAG